MRNWQFPATAHEVPLSSSFRHVTGFFYLATIASPPLSKRRNSFTVPFLGNSFHQDCCNLYNQARYKLFLLIHGKSILCFQHHTTKLHLLHLLLKAICKGMVFFSISFLSVPMVLHCILCYIMP